MNKCTPTNFDIYSVDLLISTFLADHNLVRHIIELLIFITMKYHQTNVLNNCYKKCVFQVIEKKSHFEISKLKVYAWLNVGESSAKCKVLS